MMCSRLIISLLVLELTTSLSPIDGMPRMVLVPGENQPETEVGSHQLSKRQASCLFFFLTEPPSSLQCNPQNDNTLTLSCNFLVGNTRTRLALDIGWFFSSDGVVGELVQTSRFEARAIFSAFESVLVVSFTPSV